jgi:hypothetical protein
MAQAPQPSPAPAAERAGRMYTVSPLPTLRDGLDPKANKDVLMTLYGQACQSWRQHVDVRFKLLALVPSLSLVALAIVFGGGVPSSGVASLPKVLLALLGLALVAGLWIYDTRNSELHDDLISRARRIEEELGVHTGLFRGRLSPRRGWIAHGTATNLIYGATLLAWLVAALYSLVVVLFQ